MKNLIGIIACLLLLFSCRSAKDIEFRYDRITDPYQYYSGVFDIVDTLLERNQLKDSLKGRPYMFYNLGKHILLISERSEGYQCYKFEINRDVSSIESDYYIFGYDNISGRFPLSQNRSFQELFAWSTRQPILYNYYNESHLDYDYNFVLYNSAGEVVLAFNQDTMVPTQKVYKAKGKDIPFKGRQSQTFMWLVYPNDWVY